MPCVFGSADSKVLFVSQNPPKGEYEGIGRKPLGEVMATDRLDCREPAFWKCRDWLALPGAFDPSRFFWIHRANCFGGIHKRCSKKFLENAVSLVEPRLMLLFGGVAAGYFFPDLMSSFQSRRMMNLVKCRELVFEKCGAKVKCHVLFHWSPLNIWRKRDPEYEDVHRKSIKDARSAIDDVYPEYKIQTGMNSKNH